MTDRRRIPQEQVEAILASYQRTLSTKTTADELGINADRVRLCLKQNNIPLSDSRNGVCYQHQDQIREMAAAGFSLSEMARLLGTNRARLTDFLRKRGIEIVPFQQSGSNNPAWKGGRIIEKPEGYVLIHLPEHPNCNRHGYVREHRFVMEQKLGRFLTRKEVVHHIDGNPANNDPENLELFATNGEHLAETLTGKSHNVSPEGRAVLSELTRQLNIRRGLANREKLKNDDSA